MVRLNELKFNETMTLTGVVRALDMTNGRDLDDPERAMLPEGQVLVTLLVTVEPSTSSSSK